MQFNSSPNPIFSFIVPVYNVSEYIEKCLLSIAKQTLSEIEVIVIDDGSTDRTLDICNNVASKYKNFQVYTKKNEGQGVARNYGLELAVGEYISFVDGDDWIEPSLCSDIKKILDDTGADFVNIGIDFLTLKGKVVKKISYSHLKEITGDEIFHRAMLDDQIMSSPCNKVYRRELLHKHNIRFPELRINEDIYFSRAISRVSNKAEFVSKIYYHALIRPDSTTRNISIANFEATKALVNYERKDFGKEFLDSRFNDLFEAHVVKLFSYLLILAAFRMNDDDEFIHCLEFSNRCGLYLYSRKENVLRLLKLKNRIMVTIIAHPILLRKVVSFLKLIGLSPY